MTETDQRVRVFLSWSGEASRHLANALADGMTLLSDWVEPWMSDRIEPGAQWANTLVPEIRKAHLAILCLTHRNADAPWIAFEAGLYYTWRKSIIPFLLDFPPADLRFPLGLFQSVSADMEGSKALFLRVGDLLGMDTAAVGKRFAKSIWPQLDEQIATIRATEQKPDISAPGQATNIANAFFLGHDLRWTMDVASVGPANDIKHGLVQVLHQAEELGLGEHDHFLVLRRKATDVLGLPDGEWTADVRERVALALQVAFERIGGLVIRLQPGYHPYDADNQARWLAIQAEGRA